MYTARKLCILAMAIACSSGVCSAFVDMQMMSSTRSRRSTRQTSSSIESSISSTPPPTRRTSTQASSRSTTENSGMGVTSSLISNLAVVALKLRLASNRGVKCDVTASSSDLLLKQQVGPVTVRGKAWSSQLGLTCRAIEATVQQCDLDMGSILSRRKLVLTTPAKGNAMVGLDGNDFASFITHPLMKPPQVVEGGEKDSGGKKVEFIKEGIKIDASSKTVIFHLMYDEERYKCELKRGPSDAARAIIDVTPTSEFTPADIRDATSTMLTDTISNFFNEMVFELDGTFLCFRDMMVTEKGGGATVMLALDITVRKFPSPGLAF